MSNLIKVEVYAVGASAATYGAYQGAKKAGEKILEGVDKIQSKIGKFPSADVQARAAEQEAIANAKKHKAWEKQYNKARKQAAGERNRFTKNMERMERAQARKSSKIASSQARSRRLSNAKESLSVARRKAALRLEAASSKVGSAARSASKGASQAAMSVSSAKSSATNAMSDFFNKSKNLKKALSQAENLGSGKPHPHLDKVLAKQGKPPVPKFVSKAVPKHLKSVKSVSKVPSLASLNKEVAAKKAKDAAKKAAKVKDTLDGLNYRSKPGTTWSVKPAEKSVDDIWKGINATKKPTTKAASAVSKAAPKAASAVSKAAPKAASVVAKVSTKGTSNAKAAMKAIDVAKKIGKSGMAKALAKVGGPRGAMIIAGATALAVAGAGLYSYFSQDDNVGGSGSPSREVQKAAMKSVSEAPLGSTTSETTSKAMGAATDKAKSIVRSRPETKTELTKALSDVRSSLRSMKKGADELGDVVGKAVMELSDDATELLGMGDTSLAEDEMTASGFIDKMSAAQSAMLSSMDKAMDSLFSSAEDSSGEDTKPSDTSSRRSRRSVSKEPKAGTIRNGKIYVKGYKNTKGNSVKGHWRKLSTK
jgi:hypothetical protein